MQLYSTVKFKVLQRRLVSSSLFLYLSTQINLPNVFTMAAFGTYAGFESCARSMDASVVFSSVPIFYLH